jgi:putative tryptophan/tyrosine transport system substrate-binding protein
MAVARLALIGILLGALLAIPPVVPAQQAHVYQIGVVLQGGPYLRAVDGLRDGLKELGFENGKHFVLHVRDTKGELKSVAAAAKSLEAEKVDLIYAVSVSVTLAAKQATKSVPIVFHAGTDPVAAGLVESFRRPGGRLTGIHAQSGDLTAKRLELLKELVPRLHRIVTFYNSDNPSSQEAMKIARHAAPQLKLELVERPVPSVDALRAGLRAIRAGEADAFFYVADAMVHSQADWIIDTANTKRLPTMFADADAVAQGALAGYGLSSYYMVGRQAAKYVQRILLGANPADLPVEQLDTPQFAINLKTATILALAIPQSVLTRADEVIR